MDCAQFVCGGGRAALLLCAFVLLPPLIPPPLPLPINAVTTELAVPTPLWEPEIGYTPTEPGSQSDLIQVSSFLLRLSFLLSREIKCVYS